MEFASRRTSVLTLAAGLALLTFDGCRCRRNDARTGRGPHDAVSEQPSTFALAGRVTDEIGRAVPGARVLAFRVPLDAGAGAPPHEAASDLGGRFVFDGLPRGRYRLLVEAAGLASTEPPPVELPGGETIVRLSGLGKSLAGAVVARGAPSVGARVRLAAEGGGGPARETLSDDEGRFVFHGLGAGTYALRATRGTLASPVLGGVATDEPDGPPGPRAGTPRVRARAPVRLELGPGLGVVGQVVDDQGQAMGAVEVRVEAVPDDPLAERGTSGPDGRFRAGPLPPGPVRLLARAPGYVLRAPVSVRLSAQASVPPQRLELVRGATLDGRVVDARGAPVAGAFIRCGGAGADVEDLAVIFAPLPLAAEAAALGAATGRALGSAKSTRSDARGAFHLADLLPGVLHLEVTRAPFGPLDTGALTLAPGEHHDVGALILRELAVGADAGAAPVAVTPTRADATVDGIARDSEHRPLARARVRAFALGAAGDSALRPPAPGTAPLGSTLTDVGGHFTLTHVPAQRLLLELDHPSYPVTLVAATPGGAVDLTVPVGGGIEGEVHEHVTGAVIARARVEAVGPAGEKATAVARTKGGAGIGFRLSRLRSGPWTLTATAPGFRAGTRAVDVPPSAILGESSVRGLRLELDVAR